MSSTPAAGACPTDNVRAVSATACAACATAGGPGTVTEDGGAPEASQAWIAHASFADTRALHADDLSRRLVHDRASRDGLTGP